MIIYFNTKDKNNNVETIDELDSKKFKTIKEFRVEKRRLQNEYHLSGIDVYLSRRSTKDWKNN